MLIKEMFMRSLENPEVIKILMNGVLKIYGLIMNPIITLIIVVCVVSYLVSLVVNTKSKLTGKFNIKNLKEHFKVRKKDIKERFTGGKVLEISKNWFMKIKPYIWKCRYLIIGYILIRLSWILVSLGFRTINTKTTITMGGCDGIENKLLGMRSLYTVTFFIVAPIFITFCFGNKFVRNIGIFIYILGVCFLFLGHFLSLGCPII